MKTINRDELIKGLKEFRINNGYRLQDIADYCHYTVQYIHKFENGRSNSMDILLKYIQLGFKIEDYLHEV